MAKFKTANVNLTATGESQTSNLQSKSVCRGRTKCNALTSVLISIVLQVIQGFTELTLSRIPDTFGCSLHPVHPLPLKLQER